MDSFFSKAASSFLSSQPEEKEETPKPAATHVSKHEEEPHPKPAAGSGGYGDLLSGMQSLMQGDEKKKAGDGAGSTTEGSGNLLASAQAMMGAAKPKGGDVEGHKSSPTSGQPDLAASAQVLMKAAKERGQADMGEVAGATANLLGAASEYGHIKGTSYGEYADKAETYLHDYQASHRKPVSVPETPSKRSEEDVPPPSKTPSKPAHEQDDESRE